MGGHAWYWSYSNSDVAHNYPGNKIAKETGLFVSSDWGYNDVFFQNLPNQYSTISNAISGVFADRIDGVEMSSEDAAAAYSALSDCTWIVTLDYTNFWSPLRHLVNLTGYTVIPYSTLWKFKLRPWGRFGYISQLSGMPPDQVGDKFGIISLTVKSRLYGS